MRTFATCGLVITLAITLALAIILKSDVQAATTDGERFMAMLPTAISGLICLVLLVIAVAVVFAPITEGTVVNHQYVEARPVPLSANLDASFSVAIPTRFPDIPAHWELLIQDERGHREWVGIRVDDQSQLPPIGSNWQRSSSPM